MKWTVEYDAEKNTLQFLGINMGYTNEVYPIVARRGDIVVIKLNRPSEFCVYELIQRGDGLYTAKELIQFPVRRRGNND